MGETSAVGQWQHKAALSFVACGVCSGACSRDFELTRCLCFHVMESVPVCVAGGRGGRLGREEGGGGGGKLSEYVEVLSEVMQVFVKRFLGCCGQVFEGLEHH